MFPVPWLTQLYTHIHTTTHNIDHKIHMTMCDLKVILMCSGHGSDPSTYKPHRDESQWWNRRDALVRCVSAFLLGPSPAADSSSLSGNETSRRELVLLHDGDLSRTHMQWNPSLEQKKKTKSTPVSPCESVIVELWKRAVTKHDGKSLKFALHETEKHHNVVVTTVTETGTLSCYHIPFRSMIPTPTAAKMAKGSITPSGMESKRGILGYLQQECSLEFLRQHGLNSSFDVILRKTNKHKLMAVLRAWQTQTSKTHHNDDDDNKTQKKGQLSLQSIFAELLQPRHVDIKVIAATLHESSDSELPCFPKRLSSEKKGTSSDKLQVCLFLGAVRDMEKIEYQALQKACCHTEGSKVIPLVRVRLSSVSEFTSKILSVVAFHHAQGVLGDSLEKLVEVQIEKTIGRATAAVVHKANPNNKDGENSIDHKRKRSPPSTDGDDGRDQTIDLSLNHHHHHHLHVLCIVPLPAKDVVLDLKHRNGTLWRLVRITVCTLWRSRLASRQQQQTTSPSLQTSLTLVFQDGTYFTMQQDDLVSSLAEQHQAAPSEFQILTALIAKCSVNKNDTGVSWMAFARQIVQEVTRPNTRNPTETDPPAVNVISMATQVSQSLQKKMYEHNHLTSQFYSSTVACSSLSSAEKTVLLTTLREDDSSLDKGSGKVYPSVSFLQHCIMDQFRRPPHLFHVYEQNILSSSCEDMEACTITVLQHFFYQNRVFLPALKANERVTGKKPRNEKKKKKKQ